MAQIIPHESVDQVRLASDIVEVISGYMTLTKKGRNYFGLCPFHNEKTPSFSVNPEMQIFHCFGCGAGGNVFTFVMKIDGLTFPETVKQLAQAAGILLPEEKVDIDQFREKEALFYVNKAAEEYFLSNLVNNPSAQKARDYLGQRGIESDDYQEYGIGFALDEWDGFINYAKKKSINIELLRKAGLVISKEDDKHYDRFRGRITFAIHSLSNQAIAFGARRIVNDDSPKYINSPETNVYKKRFVLYGLNKAKDEIRTGQKIIFVEGYTDLISLHKAGFRNVVATSGTSLTEDHAKLVRRYTSNATILFDSDSAGAAAAMRGADLLLENGFEVTIAQLPVGQDPDDFARNHPPDEVKALLDSAIPLIDFKLEKLQSGGKLSTVNQKVDSTKDIVASISKIGDQLKQSYLLKYLSGKLQIDENILKAEATKQAKRTYRKSDTSSEAATPKQNSFFQSRRGAAELAIFEAVISNPETIPLVVRNLSSNDFTHQEIRGIIAQLEEAHGQFSDENLSQTISTLVDATLAERASAILNDTETLHTFKRVLGYIKTLQLVHIDGEIEKVREELKFKKENLVELMSTFRQLQQYRKDIQSGKFLEGTDQKK